MAVLLLWEMEHPTTAVWLGVIGCVMLGAVHAHTIGRANAARDETGRLRQVVAELQTSLVRLQAAMDGTGEGILVLDDRARIVAINASAAALLGRPAATVRGHPFPGLSPWPRLVDAVAACQRTGVEQSFEVQHEDGSRRTLSVRVQAMPGLGVVIDIDDLSRLRQLEAHRRDFVANVSHELKTPLAAIQGFVETLLDDATMDADTRQRFLGKIARQSERLAALVADLLTLSRLDEGREDQAPTEPTDLAAITRETLRDLQAMAERKRVALTGELPAAPVWVPAEPESLRQVVGNIVDNAIKYTPDGGSVTVRLAADALRCRVEVVDTGIGLSTADQERVFERFYRVDKARSRELGGTGLGLSIVKNVVRSLRGEVGVQSELGRGSTFWVDLPVAPARPV